MIQITKARESNLTTLEAFFGVHWAKQTEKQDLYRYGRFIEISGEKKGFFALIPCGNAEGWLRTFYFKEDFNPGMIMIGIDWIKQTAEQEGLKRIHVFSHSSTTETLFRSWGFDKLANQPESILESVDKRGDWWSLPLDLPTTVDKLC